MTFNESSDANQRAADHVERAAAYKVPEDVAKYVEDYFDQVNKLGGSDEDYKKFQELKQEFERKEVENPKVYKLAALEHAHPKAAANEIQHLRLEITA